MPQLNRVSRFIVMALFCLAIGCDRGPASTPAEGDSYEQMNALFQAYLEYSNANGKPPASLDELSALLEKAGHDSSVMVSMRDGKEFVCHWGAELDQASEEPIVIAYEASSVDGSRMVLTSMGAMSMREEEFRDLSFPEGFSPPPATQ